MYNEEIYSVAKEIYGSPSDNLRAVCGAVETMLLGRLRQGVDLNAIRDTFITAAGVIAAETFTGMQGAGSGVSSYTAGNVTVRRYGNGQSRSMTKYAESLLAPYLSDDGFFFTGVQC